MKTLRLISRLIAGMVFVFSGFVKAVDPLGSTYKFTDYFNAFHIGFLEPAALPLAILLSSIELVLGITLILGYRMRVAAWVLLLFMSFFTVLTFILALTNPVTDCGCFGDALILTNWETFFKNVILMIFVIIIFAGRNKYDMLHGPLIEWAVVVMFFAGVAGFSFYNYIHLPLLDFRPYSVGKNISEGMTIPEGAPEDEYSTHLIYKNRKTGEEKEFNMENFPRDTLMWQFVDASSELVKKGYEPPIHNFNIMAPDGTDITSHILSETGFTFLLISYDAANGDMTAFKHADDLFHLSQTLPDLDFYAVTASNEDVLRKLKQETNIGYDFCLADEITLKTIVRSNPGLLLIKDGTILGKWGSRDFPGREELKAYGSVFDDYPLCEGCDPEAMASPPFGALPGKLETILKYRNIHTDSVASYTMENFPRNNDNWVFKDSETKKIPSGFRSPLEDLKITSINGMDYTEMALTNPNVSFLIFLRSPYETDPVLLKKMNIFAGLAGDHLKMPFDVYGLTSLPDEDIQRFTDEFISPVEFFHVPAEALDITDYREILMVMLRHGKIEKVWKDGNFPDPAMLDQLHFKPLKTAEEVFLPFILNRYQNLSEKRLVYLLIFSFFTAVFLIRTLLDMGK